MIGCLVEGPDSIGNAIHFLAEDKIAIICIFFYCFLNILGIYFVLVVITMFGATLTAFTTSLRKAISVMLSFLVYPKPFAWVSRAQERQLKKGMVDSYLLIVARSSFPPLILA